MPRQLLLLSIAFNLFACQSVESERTVPSGAENNPVNIVTAPSVIPSSEPSVVSLPVPQSSLNLTPPAPLSSPSPTSTQKSTGSPTIIFGSSLCLSFSEKPRQDFVVSPDGNRLYLPDDYNIRVIENGEIIHTINQSEIFADSVGNCYRQIEKDTEGNLYVLQELRDNHVETEAFQVLKIQAQDLNDVKISTYFYKDFGARVFSDEFWHSNAPRHGSPSYIHINEKDELYGYFVTNDIEYPPKFYKLLPGSNELIYVDDNKIDFLYLYYSLSSYLTNLGGMVSGLTVNDQELFFFGVENAAENPQAAPSLWKIDTYKKLTKIAGDSQAGFKDGKAAEAQFNEPKYIDFDDAGNIYILDMGNKAIRKVTPEGIVTTVFSGY